MMRIIQTVTVEEELYEFSMHVSFLSMRNKGLYEVDRDAYLNDRRHLSEFEAYIQKTIDLLMFPCTIVI